MAWSGLAGEVAGRAEASPLISGWGPVAVSSGSLTTHTVWRPSRSWSRRPLRAGASTASWVTSSPTSLARPTSPATSSTCSRRQAEFGFGSEKPPAQPMAPTLRPSPNADIALGEETRGSTNRESTIQSAFPVPAPRVSFRSDCSCVYPTLPKPSHSSKTLPFASLS